MHCYAFSVVIACLLLTVSCANTTIENTPLVTTTVSEVQKLSDTEQLRSLQKNLREALKEKPENEFQSEYALLNSIDQRLAQLYKDQLLNRLNKQRQTVADAYSEIIPLPQLKRIKEPLLTDKSIVPQLLPLLLTPIEHEESITLKSIQYLKEESKKAKLGAERRANVYRHLYTLSGEAHWQMACDRQMDVILVPLRNAVEKGAFSRQVEDKVDFVRSIYQHKPDSLVDEMQDIYATIYANRYFNGLSQSNPDSAYQVIMDLTQKADFERIKTKLKPYRQKIVNDFAIMVDTSIQQASNLAQSYRWYQQQETIRRIFGMSPNTNLALTEQLFHLYQLLDTEGHHTRALGVLLAIKSIQPNFKDLSLMLSHQEAFVHETALPRLELKYFHSRFTNLNYGELITNHLAQHLKTHVPHDIRIAPSELPEEQDSNATLSTAEPADLFFTGNILVAKVNSTQKATKKQFKVIVGQDETTNPEFIAWLELPAKQRANIEKPNKSIYTDKLGEITIGSQLHRKLGVFAVSYRLVNAASEKVIYPDSITLQKDFEDESIGGFAVGDMVIPAKEAILPSDDQILEQLAQEMATEMGKQLAPIFENRELALLKIADAAAIDNSCAEEVANLAKALTILQAKGKALNTVADRLRDRAVACF